MSQVRSRPSSLGCIALLAALFVPSFAGAWPHAPSGSGILAQSPATSGSGSVTVPDGAGGAIILWSSTSRVQAQRIDEQGTRLWGEGGVAVSGLNSFLLAAESDGAGGVVYVIGDLRNSGSTGTDLYIQRLNGAGAQQWTVNGVAVCAAAGEQTNPRLTVDVDGYTEVVWEDQRNLGLSGIDIYAQRVSPSGVAQWTANGVPVCVSTGNQTRPVIGASSPTTLGFHVAWQDARTDGGDIYYQGLSASGVPQATLNGVLAHSTVTTNVQSAPELVMDGGDRSTIVWLDDRAGVGAGDLYAQRFFFTGIRYFGLGGVALCTAAGACSAPSLVTDGEGGVIAAWVDSRSGSSDIFTRKLDAIGVPRWTADGVALCTQVGTQAEPTMAPDGNGGAFVAWRDLRSGRADIYVRRVTAAGSALWTVDGVPVCTAALDQTDPSIARSGGNGLTLAWTDTRAGSAQGSIYVQRVDEWGYLGAEPVLQGVDDVPNDQGGRVKVSWDASPLDTDPLFRNITDYLVFRSAPPFAAARSMGGVPAEFAGPLGEVSPGTFFVQHSATGDYYWELITSVAASHLARYSVVAATTGDSVSGSNPLTAFLVMARTVDGAQWWPSLADSGYSVDDLAPSAPAPLTGQYSTGATRLHWNRNAEPDLAGYRLYRGTGTEFALDGAHFVAELSDTGHTDAAGAPYVYKLTALDTHGNESPVATLVPAGTLGVAEGPPTARLALSVPSPNPVRSSAGASITFTMPRAGVARLVVLDAAGRTVRRLFDGPSDAGEHAVRFDPPAAGGTLRPGMYFVRLTTPQGSATRRLSLVE